MSVHIAFIDDGVNPLLFVSAPENIVKGSFEVKDGVVTAYEGVSGSTPSHGDLCVNIFCDHVQSGYTLTFIKILDQQAKNAKPGDLITALRWCAEHGVELINVSLGTTEFYEAADLYECIRELRAENIIVVAANANRNSMTFPASFESVIGVRAMRLEQSTAFQETVYHYCPNTADHIEIICGLQYRPSRFKEYYLYSGRANSFAAPFVTAMVCDRMNEGFRNLSRIRQKLQEGAVSCEYRETTMEKQPEMPFIALCYEDACGIESFIVRLLALFKENGYFGVCLSDRLETNYRNHILQVHHEPTRSYADGVRLTARYVEPGIVLLDAARERLSLLMDEVDAVIVCNGSHSDTRSDLTVIHADQLNAESVFLAVVDCFADENEAENNPEAAPKK